MKQHLTSGDLLELTESQKHNLRDMWMPEKNNLVMAHVCKDVINEEYEAVEFVVGDIILSSRNMVLRRFSLTEDIEMDEEQDEIEEGEENEEQEINDDEDLYIEDNGPEEYFNKEDCLPMLSLGQLIELVNKAKFGQESFEITVPEINSRFSDREFIVENTFDYIFKNSELCDALWEILKAHL